jgi:hypothetical protein
MTRQDAQLLFDWLVRRYGFPGESEGSATVTLVDRDDYYKRETNRKDNANGRIRREQRHEDDQRNE